MVFEWRQVYQMVLRYILSNLLQQQHDLVEVEDGCRLAVMRGAERGYRFDGMLRV